MKRAAEEKSPQKRKKVVEKEIEDFWAKFQHQPLHVLTCQDPIHPSKIDPTCKIQFDQCRKLLESAYQFGNQIGEGMYGTVFEATFKHYSILKQLQKYAKLSKDNNHFSLVVKILQLDPENTIRVDNELTISFYMTILSLAGVSCGFIRMFDWFRCTLDLDWFGSTLDPQFGAQFPQNNPFQYMIQERVDMQLMLFFSRITFWSIKSVRSVIFQMLHALWMARRWFDFKHFDLHPGNIMVVNMSKTHRTTLWKFYIDEEKYYTVPASDTQGFVIKIIDFGLSQIRKPFPIDSPIVYKKKYFDPNYDLRHFMKETFGDSHLFSKQFKTDLERQKYQNFFKKATIKPGTKLDYRTLFTYPFLQKYTSKMEIKKQEARFSQHVQMTQWLNPNVVLGEFRRKLSRGEDWTQTPPVPRCTNCDAKMVEFMCGGLCGGAAFYCNEQCQSVHWETHKSVCIQSPSPSPITTQDVQRMTVNQSLYIASSPVDREHGYTHFDAKVSEGLRIQKPYHPKSSPAQLKINPGDSWSIRATRLGAQRFTVTYGNHEHAPSTWIVKEYPIEVVPPSH